MNTIESEVGGFFDVQYGRHRRYWWREGNRYSLDPSDHTVFNAHVLRTATARRPGRALDIGAGEGADSIRLAKLGYEVDSIDASAVACEKIESFARAEGVRVNVGQGSARTAVFENHEYDIVVMNGVLHYVDDKEDVLRRIRRSSAAGALHVISLFSSATPVPDEHAVIPVFPDDEGGVVEQFYRQHDIVAVMYQRAKIETSHPGFAEHVHSFIKMLVQLST
jgi:SAM-dependent methyltransferase